MTHSAESEQQRAPAVTEGGATAAPAATQGRDLLLALSGSAGNRAVARLLAPRRLQRQSVPPPAPSPGQVREQKLAAFRDHVANSRWSEAALEANSWSAGDIEREMKAPGVSRGARILVYKHALIEMLRWPAAVPDAIKKVDPAAAVEGRKQFFHHARSKAMWPEVAIALHGFDNDAEIAEMVAWLLPQELVQLRDVAIATGAPARVQTAIRDRTRVSVADKMGDPSEMLGHSARWVPSGGKAGRPPAPAPAADAGAPDAGPPPYVRGMPDDFAAWAEAATEGTAPKIEPATMINCWEMVLLAAYRTGVLSWKWIHDLYLATPPGSWGDELVKRLTPGGRTRYDRLTGTPRPRRGDIVLFNGPAHVALATGTRTAAGRDEVYTFWPPTTIKRYTAGQLDVVKTDTIEGLADFIDKNIAPCVVEFGAPPW